MTFAISRPAGLSRVGTLLILILLVCGSSALAGSICGHVQDSSTGMPVAQAGIFLRTPAGAYTGDYATTDAQGDYCVENLLPGTYTLEVRVDDYIVAYVNGVEVADDVSTVPLSADMPPILLEAPWPNPASSLINFRLQIQRQASLTMEIYDARGRLVRSWRADQVEPGPRRYRWDGRDRDGRPAPAGMYLVRVRTEDHAHTRSFMLTR